MQPIIEVNEISKSYRLGVINRKTFLDEMLYRWQRLRGRDPREVIGKVDQKIPQNPSLFWALKGVSFEVQQGEVTGIIGGNGSGKSTLLKILSRITTPTGGKAIIRGRVGSLLEVGTGFHPELTGRENIYLNGSILGMTRREINSRFDEIVDFSGVEKFLDTPVKRYSSGMYVRLAFAVAAHLEPDVLIIDEVLAVGDAQFQKKCLGKMDSIAKAGRTILFVSHDMQAVRKLCSHCVWLKSGQVQQIGPTESVVNAYLDLATPTSRTLPKTNTSYGITFEAAQVTLEGDDAVVSLTVSADHFQHPLACDLSLYDDQQTLIGSCIHTESGAHIPEFKGHHTFLVRFPKLLTHLRPGHYAFGVKLAIPNGTCLFNTPSLLSFTSPSPDPQLVATYGPFRLQATTSH